MAYIVYVSPTALKDLQAALEYYNEKSENLGYRFVELVDDYFKRIADFPTTSSVRYKNIRCKPLVTFPFLIMYTIDEERKTVNILRIFNSHQEPMW
jgi:toxin ParE1/3/4